MSRLAKPSTPRPGAADLRERAHGERATAYAAPALRRWAENDRGGSENLVRGRVQGRLPGCRPPSFPAESGAFLGLVDYRVNRVGCARHGASGAQGALR